MRWGASVGLALAAVAAGQAAPLPGQAPDPAVGLAEAVRAGITPEGLRRHVVAIVRHQRPSGSPGENAAIDHIVASLRAEGIPVEVHTFDAYTSDPVAARIEVVGTDLGPESITAAFSASVEGLEAVLVDAGAVEDLPELDLLTGELLRLSPEGAGGALGLEEVRTVRRPATAPGGPHAGRPRLSGAVALLTGLPMPEAAWKLERLGAVGAVFVNPEERLNELIVTTVWGSPSLRNMHRLPRLAVAQVRRSDGEALRRLLARGPVRVRLTTEVRTGWKPLRLAVARIDPPGAPEAPFVLLGGHIDAWYHGGTDEGASNAAMVELARAFHRHRSRLRRGLRVAWWPGHSNGRYAGSTWYVDRFYDELRQRAVAYLNIDGVGQVGAKRFGAATTRSLAALAAGVVRRRTGERIEPRRPGRNSDQAFNGVGLPLLQLYHRRLPEDGGTWWWHTPEDTLDKVDVEVLRADTGLYADALAALLAAPVLPVELAAEVEGIGEGIARAQERAGHRFDLGVPRRLQAELLEVARRIDRGLWAAGGEPGAGSAVGDLSSGPPAPPSAEVDLALVRVLRPLHRVLYTLSGPFHPDPAVELGLLPGLAAVEVLARADPGSDRYRFAETALVRERNRLTEALVTSLEEARRLLALVGGAGR